MARTITRRPGTHPVGVYAQVEQQLFCKTESEALKKRADTIRDKILDYLEINGEVDEKGSQSLPLPEHLFFGKKEFGSFKRERRVSPSFDEQAAEDLLQPRGLLARVTKTTVTIKSGMTVEHPFFFNSNGAVLLTGESGMLVEDADVMWTTHIDQDEIYVLNQEGLITDDELDSLFVETITWAYKPLAA